MNKPVLRNLTLQQIKEFFNSINQPAYRAIQLYQWLWKQNIRNLDKITNIPKNIIGILKDSFLLDFIEIVNVQKSSDKTIKVAFKLYDNLYVEGVVIPDKNRYTACISTQVGCPVNCAFCATGKMGFYRNLGVGEIVEQVVLLNNLCMEQFGHKLTNIVVMGMGEPFLNYENTIQALKIITSPETMNFSAKKITISTIGIPESINKFLKEEIGVNLAVSLHSPFQEKRELIIPLAKKYKLTDLIYSLKNYTKETGREITIEYVMLKNFNDQKKDALELVKICSSFKSKVNLINYNSNEKSQFEASTDENIKIFYDILKKKNINVRIRKSRGKDIDAACGQLANKIIKI
jgi:23S rRNA (adenine2503-C2)-methyltransferase